jgi:pyruvate dehydrogenase E1 component alpha subunit
MHAGTGEEAVAVGVVANLNEEDALSLTHRCSPFLVARELPLKPMLKELLGREDGMCQGKAGHMHLFSKEHRVATSGIVGASLPMGVGFALAAKQLRPKSIAVAQTGDGALNQGMVLESFNLAIAWSLPLLIVCIDNGWAITTPAGNMTGDDIRDRARAFGVRVESVNGTDLMAVFETANHLIKDIRRGKGPAFLHATVPPMDGHYLGDMLVRAANQPLGDGREILSKVVGGSQTRGGGFMARSGGLADMMNVMRKIRAVPKPGGYKDPIVLAQRQLQKAGVDYAAINAEVTEEITNAVAQAMEDSHVAA